MIETAIKHFHKIPNTQYTDTLQAQSLVEIARYRARYQAQAIAYAFMKNGLDVSESLTYAELDREASVLAGSLLKHKSEMGVTTALLLFPPGLQFVKAFWACLYAGIVAVPAYPIINTKDMGRLAKIADDCQANIVLTSSEGEKSIELWFAQKAIKGMRCICTDTTELNLADNTIDIKVSELAFLQYTSGSTGNPKGVILTHNNLLHNLQQIYTRFEHNAKSIGVIWLPPYHDMGLIGGILQPVYGGFPVYLMSPFTFIKRPLIWLQAVAKHRATTSGGPNFSFQLCVKNAHKLKERLDLSPWKVAFCGAEPIRKKTLDSFNAAFDSHGWNKNAIYPCYGMAESTLIASGGKASSPLRCVSVNPEMLRKNIVEKSQQDNASVMISCGKGADTKMLIVDPDTHDIKDHNQVGEIWLAGDSIAEGYWRNSQLSQEVFSAYTSCDQGPFLRTGDLGVLLDGELYVTGRIKELIIINGKNFYPTDFEKCVQECSEYARADSGAAFSCTTQDGDQLIIIQEVRKDRLRVVDFEQLSLQIKDSIYEEFGLIASEVLLVSQGSIPKTSSGKIKRYEIRKLYQKNMIKTLV